MIVDTDKGKLRGRRSDGVWSFKGIPYAADTGGGNRFQPPRPAAPWAGVRDALLPGDRCSQERETLADTPVLAWYGQTGSLSENCCVLNVFTPQPDAARRPVMVYIHGGGYITGGGGGPVLDGSNLARAGDVVVVTLNHRLNVFGYTHLADLDAQRFGDAANLGQLDIIAALAWIRDNIACFGGDPGNVTLFGQSGGGSKITILMGMPAARGLFHRAINMSGVSGIHVASPPATQPYVREFLRVLGLDARTLHRLQELPAETLLQARAAAVKAYGEGARPVLDGRHIPNTAMSDAGLPMHASVPLLMGTVETEATIYFRGDMRNFSVSARQVRARIQAQFGLHASEADAVMEAYRAHAPDRTPADVLVALTTDTMFRGPMLKAAEAKAGAGAAPVYVYNFTWRAPVEGGVWRAPHTIDIPFAFGNTDRARELVGAGDTPSEVSRHLMAAFVAFARTGDPNNARMPHWRPYDGESRATMTIHEECRLVDDYLGADRRAGAALRMDPLHRDALITYRD